MRRWSPGKSSSSSASASASLYNASNARALLSCYAKTRPRPSKWDDAQKWLSRAPDDDGRRRSSGADDRLLLPSSWQQKGIRRSWSNAADVDVLGAQDEGETKRVVDCVQEPERQRFVPPTLRDVGTEMTPGGSKEPSRTNTPRAALTAEPAPARGTPLRVPAAPPGQRDGESQGGSAVDLGAARESGEGREPAAGATTAVSVSPATAWNEAERAKHMARYRREELKIQAWENRERRNAELQMKMTEVKAERRKLRAQEKAAGKLATAQAVANEKRARAEARLSRRAARIRGDEGGCLLGRRGPRLPSSLLSLKLPLLCS